LLPAVIRCGYVVGDENKHVSFPEECRIGIEVAAKMAGQQKRLSVRKQSPRTLFVEIRMLEFLALAFLPGLNDFPSSNIGQSNSTAGSVLEMLVLNLPAIDERESKPV
jgi:hypothetical protein